MLSTKGKAVFVDTNEFSTLLAITSGIVPPFTLENLQDLPPNTSVEELRDTISALTGSKGRLSMGCVGVYPSSRFVRRHTLDATSKAKDPGFIEDVAANQLHIDTANSTVGVVSAQSGLPLDPSKSLQAQKELVFCGASMADLHREQERMVDAGVYPERLELGTLAAVAGIKQYINFREMKSPVLMMEVTGDCSNVFIITKDRLDISRPIPYGLNSMFPLIQQELGLKDEASAKKLFYSNTFDFTEMGSTLLRKILKELQASTGFYEVQTGQTIGHLVTTLLPQNFNWLSKALSRSLGVDLLNLEYSAWLKSMNISASESVRLDGLDNRWLNLFSLMGDYAHVTQAPAEDGKEE